ncbi:MAG: ABC transporter ATP-binding protein [Phycisphaerales bacterium]|nr:ABC transporter ATP-binding protein [Phycisphaerales bacterium]
MAMIETVNLTRHYGDVVALDDLNLTIEQGSCFGFLGPNGAGKTTTIRILATLLKPTWGEARVAGYTIGWQNPQVRPLIGYVPDVIGRYDDMLVSEYLEFFAACYGIHGSARVKALTDVLDLTDLGGAVSRPVAGLSRGMTQRLSIARVLLHDPQVLLLDEPASGLDPRARVDIRSLLSELHKMGKTILISSHVLHELSTLCDSIGIVEQGRLVFAGTLDEALAKGGPGREVEIVLKERSEEGGKLLAQVHGVSRVRLRTRDDAPMLVVTLSPDQPVETSELVSRLVTAGFHVEQVRAVEADLETVFLNLTSGAVA